MAWGTPPTAVTGAVITAANANIVRDDLNFLASPPRIKTKRTADQSIANNTITLLTWNDEYYDTEGGHSTSVNTHRLMTPTAGTYDAKLDLEFAGNATGFRGIHINVSTPTILGKTYLPLTGSAVAPVLHCSTDGVTTANQWFESEAWQTSGGSLATGSSAWNSFSICLKAI